MTDFNTFTVNALLPGHCALGLQDGRQGAHTHRKLSPVDHHPIHLHGYYFKITGTDGGEIPLSAQQVETTVLAPVGAARDIEFIADVSGDWSCTVT
jgi:hypothetical protein